MDGQADDDRAAIIDLIHRNRIAIWSGDYDAYEKCFVHAPYLTRFHASRFMGIFVRQSWEDISARMRQHFKDTSFRDAANAYDAKIENLQLRIEGNIAWGTFLTHYPNVPPERSLFLSGISQEARVFEKHDGEWRIAFWAVMDGSIGRRGAAVLHLAADGTVTWTSPPAVAMLKNDDDVVIRNGRLRIRDSRTDKKLQAAIRRAAELDKALFPAYSAEPILLEAGEGLPTKVWWLIAESGLVVFAMGEQGLNAERVDAAAIVYGLSPSQRRVAAHVVDGLSIAEIASEMKVTAHTARTHLDRIYEKTGVRTQAALVRVLLSAAAPI